jgi:hypothetical protein
MNQHARDLFEDANRVPDQSDGQNDQSDGLSKSLRNLFRRIWPKKTAVYLAIDGDITVRQAERILSGKQGVGAPVLVRLLRGEHGDAVLEAVMATAMPGWWKDAFHERRITAARRRRLQAERELRELENISTL